MIKRLKNNKKLTRALTIAIVACVVLSGFGMAIAAETTPTNIAKKSSKKGDVVLFSPASASFDMFKNFADRGNKFKNLVNNI